MNNTTTFPLSLIIKYIEQHDEDTTLPLIFDDDHYIVLSYSYVKNETYGENCYECEMLLYDEFYWLLKEIIDVDNKDIHGVNCIAHRVYPRYKKYVTTYCYSENNQEAITTEEY